MLGIWVAVNATTSTSSRPRKTTLKLWKSRPAAPAMTTRLLVTPRRLCSAGGRRLPVTALSGAEELSALPPVIHSGDMEGVRQDRRAAAETLVLEERNVVCVDGDRLRIPGAPHPADQHHRAGLAFVVKRVRKRARVLACVAQSSER